MCHPIKVPFQVPNLPASKTIKEVHYTIVYQDDSLVEEISVEYNQVDMDDVKNIEGFNFNGSQDASYISMKKTLETLESSGYREVSDFSFVLE